MCCGSVSDRVFVVWPGQTSTKAERLGVCRETMVMIQWMVKRYEQCLFKWLINVLCIYIYIYVYMYICIYV